MNTKHTPGPWAASAYSSVVGSLIRGDNANVAAVFPIPTEIGESESIANARLIAAAPDLLESLQDLGDWLAYGLEKPDRAEPTEEDLKRCQSVAAKARAAIAKATGGDK